MENNQVTQMNFYERNTQSAIDEIGAANVFIGVMIGAGTGIMVGLFTTALYFMRCKNKGGK